MTARGSSLGEEKSRGCDDTNQNFSSVDYYNEVLYLCHCSLSWEGGGNDKSFLGNCLCRGPGKDIVLLTESTSSQHFPSVYFQMQNELYVICCFLSPTLRILACDQEIMGCKRHDVSKVGGYLRVGVKGTRRWSMLREIDFVFCSLLYPQKLTQDWCHWIEWDFRLR